MIMLSVVFITDVSRVGGCGCSSTPFALALALRHDKAHAERFSQHKLGMKSQWIQASSTISSVCLACSSY